MSFPKVSLRYVDLYRELEFPELSRLFTQNKVLPHRGDRIVFPLTPILAVDLSQKVQLTVQVLRAIPVTEVIFQLHNKLVLIQLGFEDEEDAKSIFLDADGNDLLGVAGQRGL